MIRITLTRDHPITVVAASEKRYHFAQFVSGTDDIIELRLRKMVPNAQLLDVRSIIVETFGQIGRIRFGAVAIEIECFNISVRQHPLLQVRPRAGHVLKMIVESGPTNNE